MGSVFGLLTRYSWGRKLLLKYPRIFTCGFFNENGPTQQELEVGTFETYIDAYSSSSTGNNKSKSLKMSCQVVIKGPEPGYIATPYLFLALTNMVLNNQKNMVLTKNASSSGSSSAASEVVPCLNMDRGCTTPAALIGQGGALDVLVDLINKYPGFSISVSPHP